MHACRDSKLADGVRVHALQAVTGRRATAEFWDRMTKSSEPRPLVKRAMRADYPFNSPVIVRWVSNPTIRRLAAIALGLLSALVAIDVAGHIVTVFALPAWVTKSFLIFVAPIAALVVASKSHRTFVVWSRRHRGQ